MFPSRGASLAQVRRSTTRKTNNRWRWIISNYFNFPAPGPSLTPAESAANSYYGVHPGIQVDILHRAEEQLASGA
jgi:hypothetical protein